MSISDIARQYPVVLIPSGEKGPKRRNWHEYHATADQAERHVSAGGNVGILLGSVSGLIDLEADTPDAEQTLLDLFDGIPPQTPSWSSSRGIHRLFRYEERLADLGAWPKHGGLEFRLGNGRACQSVIPPSNAGGVPRQWIIDLADQEPSALPDAVIEKMLGLFAPHATRNAEPAARNPELHEHQVRTLSTYLDRALIPFNVRTDDLGRTFLDTAYCPLKGEEHTDGAAALIVNPDGSMGFNCFHSKCAGKGFDDLEQAIGPLKPIIKIGPDEDRVTAEAIRALASAPNVFQRGTLLVEIAREAPAPKLATRQSTAPRLRPIPIPSITESLSAVATFKKFNAKEKTEVRCRVPDNIVRMIDARSNWPAIRPIEGIVCSPVLLPNGEILSAPGYHEQSGLYLDSSTSWPDLMTTSEAVELIAELFCDFPFGEPCHRSGAIAALLTPLARHAYQGPTPFFLVEANTRGSGKGLLVDVLSTIAEGRRASLTSAPKGEDEFRKLLTSIALAAPTLAILDNLKGDLSSPSFEQALTAGSWRDRVLGGNKVIDLPLLTVWLATGNNCSLSADLVRRTQHIRLDSLLERPEERTGFRHPDLLGWALQERPRMVMAGLSILHGFHAAGLPDQQLTPWGSFAGWSNLVRSAVVWAGLPDPAASRALLADQADDETSQLRELMDAWAELPGPTTVARAVELTDASPIDYPKLLAFISVLHGERNRTLGTLLRDSRGRVLGARRFASTTGSTKKWFLESVKS
jgi:hypothetical protein